jgi:hypothetical protein
MFILPPILAPSQIEFFFSRFLGLSTLQESIKVPYLTLPQVRYLVPIGVLADTWDGRGLGHVTPTLREGLPRSKKKLVCI